MRIGLPTGPGQDLRISGFTGPPPGAHPDHGGFLKIEMTWAQWDALEVGDYPADWSEEVKDLVRTDWDTLVADAEHLRATGEFRHRGAVRQYPPTEEAT